RLRDTGYEGAREGVTEWVGPGTAGLSAGDQAEQREGSRIAAHHRYAAGAGFHRFVLEHGHIRAVRSAAAIAGELVLVQAGTIAGGYVQSVVIGARRIGPV